MDLTRSVYAATQCFPKEELFGLTSQMRRAAVSIPSNIAEGQGRLTDRIFSVFLAQARGSLFELQTQLELSANLGYLEVSRRQELMTETEEIARMLGPVNPTGMAVTGAGFSQIEERRARCNWLLKRGATTR